MNISWYISLKDEELSPATQPRLSTYPKGRYFSCFPDSGIPMRRCKRQDGTNITDNLVKNSFISKESQILDIGINEELASLFARALEVAEADKTAAQQYLSGIVLHIMGAVLAISQNKRYEVDNAAQKIESAKIIMHENVYKDIDPEELAMKLGISYSWFRKVFKEYTGYAPAKYFQELKLRKAKQLLIESSMSVKEICYELNYTSTEHFFSVFKKRTNFTPTEYRNFGRGGKEKENENE